LTPSVQRCPARVVVGIAALILVWQLILPPAVSMANNGDFGKLLGRFGLGSDVVFKHPNTRYVFADRYRWNSKVWSSELLLILPALALNRVLSKDGSFDLRLMGLTQGGLFLVAVSLFVPLLDGSSRGIQIAICAATLFMFCDFTYAGYLNTVYMDVAAYLFLLLAVVLYLRAVRWHRPADSALLAICCALLVTSKPQHAILAIGFAILFWVERGVLWRGRNLVAGAVCLALLCLMPVTLRFFIPHDYWATTAFNVIFAQILPNSRNVDGALRELGLDDSYRPWIGKNAFSPGSQLEDPAFYEPFLRRVSHEEIAMFYLRHPSDAYRAFRTTLGEAGRYRLPMGNFDVSSGKPPLTENRSFSLWSDLKRRLYYHRGPRLLFSFLGLAALVAALLAANRRSFPAGAMAGGVAFLCMAFLEMTVSSLAEIFDPARHNLIFFAQFDMLLLAAIWLAERYVREKWGSLRVR